MPGRAQGRGRGYARVARVNESLREVVAEELERIGDERLDLVTITGVRVDPDLRRALVWFSALTDPAAVAGSTTATEAPADLLAEHRIRLQAAVGRQLRLKRTPELRFRPDPAIALGTRVEDILSGLGDRDEDDRGTGPPRGSRG